MSETLSKAIEAVKNYQYSFCKFVSANDAGTTGAHQAGIYIPKNSIQLLFDSPGVKGFNKDKEATITWNDGVVSKCRMIYYGTGTRNEYRITRLGRHLKENDLVVITKKTEDEYLGFIIQDDNEISLFLEEFELVKEDTNSIIPVTQDNSEKFSFKPRARIIQIIGQELISNDVIALVELIKNSYDADATQIDIELNDIFSPNGEIIIRDNGLGMTHEKIINVWLEPATPDKKTKDEIKFSKCFKRRLLGEKGIGRFAAHRLGQHIELISRAKEDCSSEPFEYETKVKIDWSLFTEDTYLDKVPVNVTKVLNPVVFTQNSGTIIKITGIHAWKDSKAVKDTWIKIKGLESPVKPEKITTHSEGAIDPGVSIDLSSTDIILNTELKALKSLNDLLDTAFYRFKASISADGQIRYNYIFDRVDYQGIKRGNLSDPEQTDDLMKYDVEWFEEHPLTDINTPGDFEINFYAWDLDTSALKVAGLADYYKNIIKPNAGVRIYRDGFRVWPYGEEDNDWLNLDLKRLNAPKERSVSRNQVFGIVHISSKDNNALKDQSNREGLIVNEQYEQFHHLVNASLSLFAKERKKDKIQIDKVTVSKKSNDIVTESIDQLREKLDTNNHLSIYKTEVDKIETSYQNRVNDILERYMMAAAIGISYSIPIHEMKLRLTSIKHVIEDIERNAQLEDHYLRELAKQLNDTEDIIRAVSSIMSRQKKQKVSLEKVAKNIFILKESELIKHSISLKILVDTNVEVEAVPGLLNTAVLNLVDNAIYWLRAKKIETLQQNIIFKPEIVISIRNEKGKGVLEVRDNGNGFDDPFELLIEPYYSKKSDGLGLGLYLVNEILIRLNGRFEGYNETGAVFRLLFNL